MDNFLQAIDTLTIKFTLAAVLLPLLAFIINLAIPGKKNKITGLISTGAILASSVLSVFVFSKVWNGHLVHQSITWFTIGNTKVFAGILLNNLSVLMLLLVNLIALPVHIYSTAYMKDDEGYNRYFAYLSLFCFSMLALVVADNLVLFYIFWELVGFSSYLLIGFWFTRDKAVQANKKAFIMNRIGDIGLLTAIIIIFTQFRTFDLDTLFGSVNIGKFTSVHEGLWSFNTNLTNQFGSVWIMGNVIQLPVVWQYVAFGGILLAVAAKSAQFPLHTWLPDAMEGPTSVSALIHAATMVAAGVFLLGRVYPMFNGTELTILAVTGCFTAFMAATIALTQNDLKRILAYSTISQLGYMIMAMGIGAYSSSLFHLVTHAFFKCLLFLVAGVVIHQMAHIRDDNKLNIDAQNILNMGGLRKKMPLTFITALIGGLALIGLPFTSGYLSKDGILIQAFQWSAGKSAIHMLIPVFAVLTTWLTAFYVIRLIVKVFFGDMRLLAAHPELKLHITDGGWQYTLPLVILAAGSLFPFFSLNPLSYGQSWLFKAFSAAGGGNGESLFHVIVPVGVNIFSLLVICGAYVIYAKRKVSPFLQTGLFWRLSFNEWYFDKLYTNYIVKPVLAVGRATFRFDRRVIDTFIHAIAYSVMALARLAVWIDHYIIDGFLYLVTDIVKVIGNFARRFQGGKVQYYLYSMLVVILAIFAFFLLKSEV
ncbi:NADH-quinone oxidoreductase subunit L [Mucilaginibacter xinganensis]|uniref:NADH-quinone oxidoreductase subunit L n=1 Tax=Mucilaginibacter xinganensis TaxID=1234841 RepID=A0A223NTV0_9SPHI|nr:NADH-quinone oxidoreductase subunit L [Mucilaginibacter xinganensis]ASU33293.1 NADH-quinone oxidoreductase subunit L [Mucilaginibacter xinganensis]